MCSIVFWPRSDLVLCSLLFELYFCASSDLSEEGDYRQNCENKIQSVRNKKMNSPLRKKKLEMNLRVWAWNKHSVVSLGPSAAGSFPLLQQEEWLSLTKHFPQRNKQKQPRPSTTEENHVSWIRLPFHFIHNNLKRKVPCLPILTGLFNATKSPKWFADALPTLWVHGPGAELWGWSAKQPLKSMGGHCKWP